MSVGDVADLVTAGIAGLAFGAAVWQVRSSNRSSAETIAHAATHARQERTIAYSSRLSDAAFMKRLAHTNEQLASPTDSRSQDGRWAAFKAMSIEQQFDIAAPLNAFEEVGTLYNLGHLDRPLVDRQLAQVVRVLYGRVEWWIERTRERGPTRYCEWERMVRDLGGPIPPER